MHSSKMIQTRIPNNAHAHARTSSAIPHTHRLCLGKENNLGFLHRRVFPCIVAQQDWGVPVTCC